MKLNIKPDIALTPLTCARCETLGLPPGGIAPGEHCFLLTHERKSLYCCADCFNRLLEEVLTL